MIEELSDSLALVVIVSQILFVIFAAFMAWRARKELLVEKERTRGMREMMNGLVIWGFRSDLARREASLKKSNKPAGAADAQLD